MGMAATAGTAGTGKSRTVRAIAAARRCLARAVAARKSEAINEEDIRNAAVLVAPTGCASFQMKFGATTIHSAFGLGISNWCGPSGNRSDPAFVRRLRRLPAASLVVMDECSMIGGLMMWSQLSLLGGKDVMFAGDPDLAKPIADESGHTRGNDHS